jgi:hypothetical protein
MNGHRSYDIGEDFERPGRQSVRQNLAIQFIEAFAARPAMTIVTMVIGSSNQIMGSRPLALVQSSSQSLVRPQLTRD